MGFMTFKGGVHPHDGKEFSKDKPIREILPKDELVFPVSQHIGASASPIVAVGDTVLRGQKIAEAGGFVSAPVYSSVSGTVKALWVWEAQDFLLMSNYHRRNRRR